MEKITYDANMHCIALECTHSAQKATKLTSKSDILNTEDSDILQSSDSTNEGVPLCAEHYGAWYRSTIHHTYNAKHVARF